MKNTFFFIIIAAVVPACKTSSQEISIIPLTMLKYDTTTTIEGKAFPIKWDFFW